MSPAPRRPRAATIPGPVAGSEHPARAALGAALGHCTEPQRAMLALRLVERLSPEETAAALGVTLHEFERSYRALFAELRRVTARHLSRRHTSGCGEAFDLARLRRAS